MSKVNSYRYRVSAIGAKRGQVVELPDSERTRQLLAGRVIEPVEAVKPEPKRKTKPTPKPEATAKHKATERGGGSTPAKGDPAETVETK